jgi:hypothetical protein
MRPEVFTLCKAAVVEHGALSILSAFDRLQVPALPHVLPHCSVAVRIRFDRIEEGEHELKIHFIDSDGKPLINPLQGRLGVRFAEGSRSSTVSLVVDVNNLSIPAAGEYSIDVAVDSVQLASIPLQVIHRPPQKG